MNPLLFRIGCFAVVPLGIFVLVRAIRFAKGIFYGELLLELPFAVKSAHFTVAVPGVYAIWQKGEVYKRTPIDSFKPVVYDVLSNETVWLFPSFLRPRMNDGTTGRMELSTFSALAGSYRLELQPGSGISALEKAVSSLLPGSPADTSNYFVQIRRSQPFYYKLLVAPLFMLAAGLIIGGFVTGLLADQIALTLFE